MVAIDTWLQYAWLEPEKFPIIFGHWLELVNKCGYKQLQMLLFSSLANVLSQIPEINNALFMRCGKGLSECASQMKTLILMAAE